MQKSFASSPESMVRYFKRLIKKQCRINKKVENLMSSSPPPLSMTSCKLPLKTSRLSPFVNKPIQLKPLPSCITQPKPVKKIGRASETKSLEKKLEMLSISSKTLSKRLEKSINSKKIEVGINTKQEVFSDLDEESCEDDHYFVYKGL